MSLNRWCIDHKSNRIQHIEGIVLDHNRNHIQKNAGRATNIECIGSCCIMSLRMSH
jgi:hypothetical protein